MMMTVVIRRAGKGRQLQARPGQTRALCKVALSPGSSFFQINRKKKKMQSGIRMEMQVKIARAAQIHSHRAESGRVETRPCHSVPGSQAKQSEILGSAPMNLYVLFCFTSRCLSFFLFLLHPGADADPDASLHSNTWTGWDGRCPYLLPGLGLCSTLSHTCLLDRPLRGNSVTPWCGGCYVRDRALTQMSMPQHRIGPGGGMLEQLGCWSLTGATCASGEGPGQALRPDSPHFCRVWQGPWRGRRVLEHAVYALNGALMGSYGARPVLQVMKLACAGSSCRRWKKERIFHITHEWLMPAKKKIEDWNATWRQDIAPTWIEMAAAQFTACVIPVAAHRVNSAISRPAWEAD
ncbi:hypothetical protein HDV64DRAFT_136632 [Trichoderma sp. TUCIM 5745]